MKLTFKKPIDASGYNGDLGVVESAELLTLDFETGEVRFSLGTAAVFGIVLDPVPLDPALLTEAIRAVVAVG